jgi:transmembrane sensor
VNSSPADARRARAAADAADWAARMDAGELSKPERIEFVDWLRESPVHIGEMLRIGRLTSALAALDGWEQHQPAGDSRAGTVVALGQRPAPERERQRARSRRKMWAGGVAAALALVTVSGVLLRLQTSTTVVHTKVGERHELTLSDGSVVRLSPSTDLRIQLQARQRAVTIDRGEATFRVAKDQARPFVVAAAGARVQAVGTVFSVARNADAVIVTVAEGRVSVMPAAEAADPRSQRQMFAAVSVQANERVSVSAGGEVSPVRRIEPPATVEWGTDQLVFVDMSVADVVARFNGRNRIQIRITDRTLYSHTVSGVFAADDPRSFVEFLQSVAGPSSIEYRPDEIVVTPLSAGSGPAVPVR